MAYLKCSVPGVLLMFFAGANALFADSKSCDASTLQGSFGYTVTGFINPGSVPALIPGAFAAVGRLVFDGHSGVTTVRSLSDNGTILRNDAGSGTYTLKADCTGSFSISIATPTGTVALNLDVVVAGNGGEIRAIVTNSGYVLTLQGTRQAEN